MLLAKFKAYIERERLFSADDQIIAGVSGGIDSMVMLRLLFECGYRIAVAHCNFSLRGEESDGDEQLVEETAKQYNIPLYSVRFNTHKEAEKQGESIQMAARRLRYEWFEELADKYGYNKIAIAHNNDDTIETFFINLIRGTGIRGLNGIPVTNGKIVRPLIFAPRNEIEEYACNNCIAYRDDSTNASDKYLRNKIRHNLIPRFKEIADGFNITMTDNLYHISNTATLLYSFIGKLKKEAISPQGTDCFTIDLNKLSGYTPSDYLLFEIMRDWKFKYLTVQELSRCIEAKESGRQFLSSTHTALLDRKKIIIAPRKTSSFPKEQITITSEGTFTFGNFIFSFRIIPREKVSTLKTAPDTALVDADKAEFPLIIRHICYGGAFHPLGMKGTKKISDFLIDAKIPLTDKPYQTVVTHKGHIIWLTGFRLDECYKIVPETRRILEIKIDRPNDTF